MGIWWLPFLLSAYLQGIQGTQGALTVRLAVPLEDSLTLHTPWGPRFVPSTKEPFRNEQRAYFPVYELWVALDSAVSNLRVDVHPLETIERTLSSPVAAVPVSLKDGLEMVFRDTVQETVSSPPPVVQRGVFGGIRYARILWTPLLRVSPRSIRWATKVEIVVHGATPGKVEKKGMPTSMEALMRSMVINPDAVRRATRSSRIQQIQAPPQAAFWVRIPVSREGVYAITGQDLQDLGIPPATRTSLALYGTNGDTLPAHIRSAPLDSTFRLLPLRFLDHGTPGVVDASDTLLFWAEGVPTYRFRQGQWQYFEHPYTDTLIYWLAVGADTASPELPVRPVVPGNAPLLQRQAAFVRHEKNLINLAQKGLRWEGEDLYKNPGVARESLALDLSFAVPPESDTGELVFSWVGALKFPDHRYLTWRLNNGEQGQDTLFAGVTDEFFRSGRAMLYRLRTPPTRLTFVWNWPASRLGESDWLYLDFVELRYTGPLTYAPPQQIYRMQPADTGWKTVEVSQAAGIREVWDVRDPLHPVRLTGWSVQGSRLRWTDSLAGGARFVVFASPRRPASLHLGHPDRLWHWNTPVSYLIIAPRAYASVARSWAAYRSSHLPLWDGSRWTWGTGAATVVFWEDIVASFGYGVRDPVAIRNFIYSLWSGGWFPEGGFVLLLGDGTYDYKNRLGRHDHEIPPFENFEEYDINNVFRLTGALEDFYVDMDSVGEAAPLEPEYYLGRIPVNTENEARALLERIRLYESRQVAGEWMNRVVLIADDEYADQSQNETFHTLSSDRVYALLPPTTDVDLFYEIEIPDRAQRPLVGKQRMVEVLNEGSLFLNFFGHGNPVTLTHEDLLPPSSYEALDARSHGALAVFASCKVGAFDRVEPVDVIGEVLLKRNVAVGVISSTAISFAFSNEIYVRSMVQMLATGEAMPMGWLSYVGRNNRYYVLLGDPAVRIQLPFSPQISVQLPDTLTGGEPFSYTGSGNPGGRQVWVAVRGMPRDTTYVGPTVSITYTRPGPFWFRGRAAIRPDGSFGGLGILPQSLDTLHPGEVRVVDVHTGKTGYRNSLRFLLSGQIPLPGAGPEIQLSVDRQPLKTHQVYRVPSTAEVDVVVEDSQGIHPARGLRMLTLETGTIVDLMPFFQYDPGTYQRGTAHLRTTFPEGDTVHLVMQAVDNEGNETVDTFLLQVLPSQSLMVARFLPYPNPWNGQGEQVFSFWLSRRARVSLRIFSLNGKPLFVLPQQWMDAGFHVLRWRGKDLDGRPVASGLYIAQINAVDETGQQRSRKVKLLIRR